MQEIVDTGYPDEDNIELIRAFGPNIVKMRIPEQVGYDLIDLFDNNSEHPDHSMNLAGNMTREFAIDESNMQGDAAQRFVRMLANGSGELYSYSKRCIWENIRRNATAKHIEIVNERLPLMNLSCTVHQAWGNISVAGDFNPAHTHTGQISGVGYLSLPDDSEHEWATEDHDPSAGCINFSYAERNNGLGATVLRLKPEIGCIYFFPAWLNHSVYPFRSKGERWSFSFNTTVTNLTGDLELTDEDKKAMKDAKDELISQGPAKLDDTHDALNTVEVDEHGREVSADVTDVPFDEYLKSKTQWLTDRKGSQNE